ncbi:LTA synthase family protein, partial [uncultured Duncaniella sp.]
FYNAATAIVAGLMVIADTALYSFWQHKIDASVLAYLKTLKWAIASVSTLYIAGSIFALLMVAGCTYCWLELVCAVSMSHGTFIAHGIAESIVTALTGTALIGVLVVLIRGMRRRPNNPSLSYYSNNQFFNHAALNPVYAFIYSLGVNDKIEGAFHYTDSDECGKEFNDLYPASHGTSEKALNTNRPNVLFIIWESLSARFVEELGGEKDVTPNINRLSHEGLFFTRVDSNSFRTDRGLVALLSGYLAQPTTSVIRMTNKLPNLPAFPKKFKDAGYETTAVHGGDLMVFHMSEYFLTIGHDHIVSEPDFPPSMSRGKWGVPDGEVFEWVYEDIQNKHKEGRQWYTSLLTLSSHEDWKVPYNRIPDDEIANSFAYVDDAFGRLVDRLRQTPAWDNLLIVVTGDHGCNAGEPLSHDKYSHIPLLMLGGAVKAPRRIDTIMSQSDIASTILGQLDMPHDEFIFSRDVMSESYKYPFSYHTFINGFMFRDATGFTVVDNVTDSAISNPDKDREHKGRIILQYLYEDLAKR